MKTRQLIKGLGGALVAAALVFSLPASADPVTQLIHFDDGGNNVQWYTTADGNFTFDPTNMSGSSLCAEPTAANTGGGNGTCVLEGGQGVLPLMIRPTNQTRNADGTVNQGEPGGNAEPTFVGGDGPGILQAFTLDSFYFLLNGSGGNSMTVCGGTGAPPGDIEAIDDDKDGVPSEICDGQALSYTFTEGGGASPSGPVITYYEDYSGRGDSNAVAGTVAGPLEAQTGYIASFGSLFADVTWIQWTALGSKQFRLDCVVATFGEDGDDSSTSDPYDPKTSCGLRTPTNGVPEPGTVALLGLGLVGMGLMRRRRKV